jgi:hypothetical protein
MKAEKTDYIVLAFLVALTVVIRLPILMEPWGGDQAGFGHVAKGMLEGKVPYKDMYSLTAYGVFFTFALFFKIFGMNMVSVHLGHLVVSALTVILVYGLARSLYGRKAAVISAVAFTIFANGLAFSGTGYENKSFWGTYWYLSQREVFMAPLILGVIMLSLVGDKRAGVFPDFLSGILIGLAAFYKLTAILILLLLAVFIVSREWGGRGELNLKRVIGHLFSLVLGFILVQLPFLFYFWIHGALNEVYQALFVHLSAYVKLSRGSRIATLFSGHYSVLGENLALWLFAAISCLYILFRDRTRQNILVVLWTLSSLLMVWGQGKFFGYHFIILLPPFAVLIGYGLPKFLAGGPGLKGFLVDNLRDIRKAFMLTTVVVTLAVFTLSNFGYYRRHVRYFSGKLSTEEYYDAFNEFPTHPYSFRSDYQVAQYLKENGEPGDRLGVIFSAGDTVVHFLSGMEPATRFIQSWYLFSSDRKISDNQITINLRREFVDQLMRSNPRFILCVYTPFGDLVEIPSLKRDPSVKKLDDFVRTHYRLDRTFPDNRFLFKRM